MQSTLRAIWLLVPDPFSKPELKRSFRNTTRRKYLHFRCRFTPETTYNSRSSQSDIRSRSVCSERNDRIDDLGSGRF